MASSGNTGDASNLSAFFKIVKVILEFGAKYNPAHPLLKATALVAAHAKGQKSVDDIQAAETVYRDTVNTRMAAFDNLDQYATRVVGTYAISDVDARSVENVKAVQRKLRAKSSPKKDGKKTAPEGEVKVKARVESQLGYEDRCVNFAQIAAYVESNAKYITNDEDLKVEAVRAYSNKLHQVNEACLEGERAIETARINRDKILYTNDDSLYNLFKDAKTYIKTLYGPSSQEYKRVSGVEFKIRTKTS